MEKILNQYAQTFKGKDFLIVQNVVTKLYNLPRTGWFDRGVENPETVGEHTDELVIISETFYNIPGLSEMLKIHDWPESDSKVGDRRTDNFCPDNRRWSKEQKYIAELKAMKNICCSLESSGDTILKLWIEFEEQKTRRALIARQLDKLQGIMKAIEYQRQGQPVIAQEFIDWDGAKVTDPILKQILEEGILLLQ